MQFSGEKSTLKIEVIHHRAIPWAGCPVITRYTMYPAEHCGLSTNSSITPARQDTRSIMIVRHMLRRSISYINQILNFDPGSNTIPNPNPNPNLEPYHNPNPTS